MLCMRWVGTRVLHHSARKSASQPASQSLSQSAPVAEVVQAIMYETGIVWDREEGGS